MVKLIECPRDALQGCPRTIPTQIKVELLRRLLTAGLRHLDCASFVSPKTVPQMADSEEVLNQLATLPAGTELIGIVLNERGVERAAATSVTTVGFPYSVSPTFQRNNANQTPAEALNILRRIKKRADAAHLNTAVYISMAFGNPYGDPWCEQVVVQSIAEIAELGIREFALADTVGLASPEQVSALYSAIAAEFPTLEIGAHLHSRPERAAEKVLAAWESGCRRFDSAVAGLGGCPFAGDHLVGNLPTEQVLVALKSVGVETGIDPGKLAPAIELAAQIRREYAC
jgi:hydroxymethylglutaryl-CoA lyase